MHCRQSGMENACWEKINISLFITSKNKEVLIKAKETKIRYNHEVMGKNLTNCFYGKSYFHTKVIFKNGYTK